MAALRRISISVQPTRSLAISPHAADNRFYECAESASAHYLVTGNLKHFPKDHKNTKIITSRELLQLLAPKSQTR